MHAIIKLKIKPPFIVMALALHLELTLKGILKVQLRLISPLMKSSVVSDSFQWNIKWDENHLVLYFWEIGYLVSYQNGIVGIKAKGGENWWMYTKWKLMQPSQHFVNQSVKILLQLSRLRLWWYLSINFSYEINLNILMIYLVL